MTGNKRKKEYRTDIGVEKDWDVWYTENMEEFQKTEFFKSIDLKKYRDEFLKELDETGKAWTVIAGNAYGALVLYVEKTGNVVKYGAFEDKMAGEIKKEWIRITS